ncbi:MAG: glutathionylspermidine synthase family protein [Polyangiales bacterium]
MKREVRTPRAHWREDCLEVGFDYHSLGGTYWDESRCYRFEAAEIDLLEEASAELHARCLDAARHIVAHDRFDALAIPDEWRARVAQSLEAREFDLYGRFDLAYDGSGPPKLLEYNADTPTSLLEAAVVQWRWLEQAVRPSAPDADQFNSLHEKLIDRFRWFGMGTGGREPVHFTAMMQSPEDAGNLAYLCDVATQAGLDVRTLPIEQVGWDSANHEFVDQHDQPLRTLFKLYPWEWLAREQFGPQLANARLRAIEPPWKMLLSNKGLLPILWELFPDHPNLLPAYFEPERLGGDWVEKPLRSREGANVRLHIGGQVISSGGDYAEERTIFQRYAPLHCEGGDHLTIGAWMVGDEPAGIGLREDDSPITRDTSRFVPHYFV